MIRLHQSSRQVVLARGLLVLLAAACVCVGCLAPAARAFSHAGRRVSLPVEIGSTRDTLVFDPVVEDIETTVDKLCAQQGMSCSTTVREELVDTAWKQLVQDPQAVWKEHFESMRKEADLVLERRLEEIPEAAWVSHGDNNTHDEFVGVWYEARNLLDGLVAQRPICTDRETRENALRYGACPLAAMEAEAAAGTLSWTRAGFSLLRSLALHQAKAIMLFGLQQEQATTGEQADACECLAHIYTLSGDTDKATQFFLHKLWLRRPGAPANPADLAAAAHDGTAEGPDKDATARDHGQEAEQVAATRVDILSTRLKLAALVPGMFTISEADLLQRRRELLGGMRAMHRSLVQDAARGEATTISTPVERLGFTLFYLAHEGLDNRAIQEAMHDVLMASCRPALEYTAPHVRDTRQCAQPSALGSGMRIGFISAYFVEHSIGKMMAEMFISLSVDEELHQRGVEVYIFLAAEIDTDVDANTKGDRILQNLRRHVPAARFVVVRKDLAAAHAQVASYELDMLIYTDVGMDPFTYYLAFSRLAHTQVAWWGHPDTTGLSDTMDFYFTLDTEVEHAHTLYTEQAVRMDIVNVAPFVAVRENDREHTLTKEHFGVPGAAHVHLVLGRLFKLHPQFDEIMLDVLLADPEAHIFLIRERVFQWNHIALSRFRRAAQRRFPNVTPADLESALVSRLRFVHYWEFVQALFLAESVLDTYPYGGCLTVLDALSNGVPVVTLPSEFVRGRFAMSMYRQMGFMGLVARDAQHYVQMVNELALNQTVNTLVRERIRATYPRLNQNRASGAEWFRFADRAVRQQRMTDAHQCASA